MELTQGNAARRQRRSSAFPQKRRGCSIVPAGNSGVLLPENRCCGEATRFSWQRSVCRRSRSARCLRSARWYCKRSSTATAPTASTATPPQTRSAAFFSCRCSRAAQGMKRSPRRISAPERRIACGAAGGCCCSADWRSISRSPRQRCSAQMFLRASISPTGAALPSRSPARIFCFSSRIISCNSEKPASKPYSRRI